MTIVTWNCNGGFRKKYQHLEQFNADIIIIQECENPEVSTDKTYKSWASNYCWSGDNKNKGLGIFCKNHIKLANNNWANNETKHFISANINQEFDIIAVWNHHAKSPNFKYIGQLWKYLQINKKLIAKTIIIGDFNSNTIWDEWDRWWNHSDVVKELNELGIKSLYHEYYKEEQGLEKRPTFFLHRNILKPYHIDYIFLYQELIEKVKKFEIRNSKEWLETSDHLPLIAQF
jgi:exonuclease III